MTQICRTHNCVSGAKQGSETVLIMESNFCNVTSVVTLHSFFLAVQVLLGLHYDYKVAAEQLCARDLAKYCKY